MYPPIGSTQRLARSVPRLVRLQLCLGNVRELRGELSEEHLAAFPGYLEVAVNLAKSQQVLFGPLPS